MSTRKKSPGTAMVAAAALFTAVLCVVASPSYGSVITFVTPGEFTVMVP